MSEVLLPEPYYSGNIRTVTDSESSKTRPKTVPSTFGASRNENSSLYRPTSGCRRLNECVQEPSSAPRIPGGVYRMPANHRLQKMKNKRPQSPLEVISEQPGVRVMKSKSGFVAEVAFGPEPPSYAPRSNVTTKEGNKPPTRVQETASAILRQDMEEDTALTIRIKELEQMLKVKEAELALKEKITRQLQQQVDDFQLQLGEERLNFSEMKKTFEEQLASLRIKKDQEMQTAIKNLTLKYDAKIDEINTAHEDQVNDLKASHARTQKRLEDQIEHLENAFDEFRVSFTSEMELKWKRREEEMRKKIQDDADARWTAVVNKNKENHEDEIARLKKKQAEEMEVVKHEHESEINSLLRKYKDAYSLSEKVARQQQLIEGLHERLREFETKVEDTTHQLADKTREAAELTMKLTTMERDFSTKLQQNAEMWQRRLEGYVSENADIKRLYAFSVHKQSCDRLERDLEMRDRARNATQLANARLQYREQLVEAVLHSRLRTGLPLVPSNPPTEDEERRVRQAQLLRKRAAKLGASAIAEASDLLQPGDAIGGEPRATTSSNKPTSRGGEKASTAEAAAAQRNKLNSDLFVVTAGRPMSAPTTEVENFCVFMAAAAALGGSGGGKDRKDSGEKNDEAATKPSTSETSLSGNKTAPSAKRRPTIK